MRIAKFAAHHAAISSHALMSHPCPALAGCIELPYLKGHECSKAHRRDCCAGLGLWAIPDAREALGAQWPRGDANVPAVLKRLRPRTQCCRLRAGHEAGASSADFRSNDGRSRAYIPSHCGNMATGECSVRCSCPAHAQTGTYSASRNSISGDDQHDGPSIGRSRPTTPAARDDAGCNQSSFRRPPPSSPSSVECG